MFAKAIHHRFIAGSVTVMVAMAAVSSSVIQANAQSSNPPSRPKREYDPEQYYRAPSTMRGKTVLIPMGTVFEGKIDETISSQYSHSGQRFRIVLSSPVMLNGTDVVIPVGSAVVGEVVEAMPASRVPRLLGQDKRLIKGKLRIQMDGLKTPDGVTYPLVASLAGEIPHGSGNWNKYKTPLGTGVAYMGSAASFEGVDPSRRSFTVDGRTGRVIPKVVTKKELLKDELLGHGDEMFQTNDENIVRSLVLNKRDYYIYQGSPLSVRLTAPFKIGMNPPGAGVPMGEVQEGPADDALPPPSAAAATTTGGRFNRAGAGDSNAQIPEQGQSQQQPRPVANPGGGVVPADSF
jgi:hypothetical protein